jgi:hypothetical protein
MRSVEKINHAFFGGDGRRLRLLPGIRVDQRRLDRAPRRLRGDHARTALRHQPSPDLGGDLRSGDGPARVAVK